MTVNFLNMPVALQASVTKTADFDGAGVDVHQGQFWVHIDYSAAEWTTEDETYSFSVQANTAAATTTWTKISGDVKLIPAAVDEAGTISILCQNKNDYQIRLSLDVEGTTPSITYSADIVPNVDVFKTTSVFTVDS